MSANTIRKVLTLLILFSVGFACCEAQTRTRGKNPEKALFGKSVKTKQTKVKESRKVVQAKKTQAKKEEKLKKEYNKYIEDSRKRNFEIQTPKVKERMKQDQKNIAARDKMKKKKTNAATKRLLPTPKTGRAHSVLAIDERRCGNRSGRLRRTLQSAKQPTTGGYLVLARDLPFCPRLAGTQTIPPIRKEF